MNMPSGWKTGTHEIVQDLNILALKSLLELLLSICVLPKTSLKNFDGASYEINP